MQWKPDLLLKFYINLLGSFLCIQSRLFVFNRSSAKNATFKSIFDFRLKLPKLLCSFLAAHSHLHKSKILDSFPFWWRFFPFSHTHSNCVEFGAVKLVRISHNSNQLKEDSKCTLHMLCYHLSLLLYIKINSFFETSCSFFSGANTHMSFIFGTFLFEIFYPKCDHEPL